MWYLLARLVWSNIMESNEFARIRVYLEKTQREMAQLLGVSVKAVQSFEQGWRNIPVHIERQLLFILSMKEGGDTQQKQCWQLMKCPMDRKRQCPAFEFQMGKFCWFVSGTICQGKVHDNWSDKMTACRSCKVFKEKLPRGLMGS